jgi:hypothetical protein
MGTTKATDLAKLFTLMPQGANVTADTAAAFQAAVWEVVNETDYDRVTQSYDYDVTKGSFKIVANSGDGTDWVALANTYLTDMESAKAASVYAIYSASTQNFAFLVPTEGSGVVVNSIVPEPITFITGLLVVSGLGAYIRRRTRVAKA